MSLIFLACDRNKPSIVAEGNFRKLAPDELIAEGDYFSLAFLDKEQFLIPIDPNLIGREADWTGYSTHEYYRPLNEVATTWAQENHT